MSKGVTTMRIVDTTVPTDDETISVQATKKRDKALTEEKESGEPQPAGMKIIPSNPAEAEANTGKKKKDVQTTEEGTEVRSKQ